MNYIIIIILIIILFIIITTIYNVYSYNTILTDKDIINKNNYDKNKKTCILMSGQIRGDFMKIYLSQKIFLIDPLNADIFCVFSYDIDDKEKKKIEKIIDPKKILWVNENNKINNNLFLMYHKIYLCNKLKKDYEKEKGIEYDICIRIRPDLFIKSYIPENIINNMDSNTFYTPLLSILDFSSRPNGIGVTDQIFVCNTKIMDNISNIYFELNNIKKNCDSSEIKLKKYILNLGINIQRFYNYKFILYNYSNIDILTFIKLANYKKKDTFYRFNINCYK